MDRGICSSSGSAAEMEAGTQAGSGQLRVRGAREEWQMQWTHNRSGTRGGAAAAVDAGLWCLEKYDHNQLKKTRKVLERRHHAFRGIWGGSGPGNCCLPPIPCALGVNWKQWPPALPVVPEGLKIPVEVTPARMKNPKPKDFCIGVEDYQLVEEGPADLFDNFKGILNCPESLSCSVSPAQVQFINSQVGQHYSVTVKVQNKSRLPIKIGALRPTNKFFDITWGAELNESTMVSPGLSARIVVEFRPKSDESITDLLTVIVHGDGNIVVPIVANSITPPVLEVDEWDCGCSVVGQSRVSTFEINNGGGDGRFWIVSEEEFNKEDFGAQLHDKPEARDRKMDRLYKKPFKIGPAAFRLLKNQKISLKTKFRPTQPGFHYEKVAMLCDNGEVRWIAIKGIGLGAEKQPLVTVTGEWSAPPCDLPTDIGTKFAIDCGDLLPGQTGKPAVTLMNTSCIPVYFFWSIRPLHTGPDPLNMENFQESPTFDWKDHYETVQAEESQWNAKPMEIQVHPAQGILEPFQELNACLIIEAPEAKLKFHSCVISLFVQQLEDKPIKAKLSRKLAKLEALGVEFMEKPIFFSEVTKNMPAVASDEELEEQEPSESRKVSNSPEPLLYMKLVKKGPGFHLAELRHPADHRPPRQTTENVDKGENSEGESETAVDVDCIGECFANIEKRWLHNDSFLIPSFEVEVWARTVPIQVSFDPPLLLGFGAPMERLERLFVCVNQTEHPIRVEWDGYLDEHCAITVEPPVFQVGASDTRQFNVISMLYNYGKISSELCGCLRFPFTPPGAAQGVMCNIPISITVQGASIESLTPVIHFGIIAQGIEVSRTFVLKNTGSHKLTWRAQLSDTQLVDEESHKFESKSQPLKVWPQWGTLEPDEEAGAQLFLCTEAAGAGPLVASIEVTVDHNPDITLYIPAFAEIQSPYLTLNQGLFELQNLFTYVTSAHSIVVLRNPTSFQVAFSWREPIGTDSSHCHIRLEPHAGVVQPRESVPCRLTVIGTKPCTIRNLFVPCCVEGMKEPLLIQVSGSVRGIEVEYIMPVTNKAEDLVLGIEAPSHTSMIDAKLSYIRKGKAEAKKKRDDEATEDQLEEIENPGEGEEEFEGHSDVRPRASAEESEAETQIETDADENEEKLENLRKKSSKRKIKRKSEPRRKTKGAKEKVESEPESSRKEKKSGKVVVIEEIVKTPSSNLEEVTGESDPWRLQRMLLPAPEDGYPLLQRLHPEDAIEMDHVHPKLPVGDTIHFYVGNLGTIASNYFVIKNKTPIPAKFSVHVQNHGVTSWIDPQTSTIQNLIARRMCSDSPSDIENRILHGKNGIAFEVYPPYGILRPHQELRVVIHLHSNAWGAYLDQIICEVEGIAEPHVIHLEAVITGCPRAVKHVAPWEPQPLLICDPHLPKFDKPDFGICPQLQMRMKMKPLPQKWNSSIRENC